MTGVKKNLVVKSIYVTNNDLRACYEGHAFRKFSGSFAQAMSEAVDHQDKIKIKTMVI